jgi:hypothetical protein
MMIDQGRAASFHEPPIRANPQSKATEQRRAEQARRPQQRPQKPCARGARSMQAAAACTLSLLISPSCLDVLTCCGWGCGSAALPCPQVGASSAARWPVGCGLLGLRWGRDGNSATHKCRSVSDACRPARAGAFSSHEAGLTQD